LIASAKGTNDSKDNTVITNPTLDTVNYLTADESANLINYNATILEEIAATLYYKDIGSREGLTVAESNVQFAAASATVKRVYRNKAITDIRKLVTEGYLKIDRTSQDVSISVEKAVL